MSSSAPDSRLPRHVAIVMDGNGRWARKRLLPRVFGHKQGMDVLVRLVRDCQERGIGYLTVFAFSSENWKRPEGEVSFLMDLVLVGVSRYLERMAADGVRVVIAGDRSAVGDKVRAAWDQAEQSTRHNTSLVLTVAFNYGGRWDMVQACRRAMELGLDPAAITETRFAELTALSHAPDPDLFIRTGGEVRISNFLLWHAAYSELYFTECLWPDFDAGELDKALSAFARRDRRYGGLNEAPADTPRAVAG